MHYTDCYKCGTEIRLRDGEWIDSGHSTECESGKHDPNSTDENELVFFQCPKCMICQEATMMTLDKTSFNKWMHGELVQRAFPNMSPEYREILITGIHPTCWNNLKWEDS